MSSNLKVNTILPSTGTNVAIGTAGGSITMVGNVDIDINSGISTFNDIHISDKIVHDGDTNTSLRFPAADTFSVETNGAERLRIRSDGKVGIGTDMVGAPASNYGFASYRATGTGYLYTETGQSSASAGLRAKAGTSDFTIFTTQGTGQLAVYDNTNSAERLRITSTGAINLTSENTTGWQLDAGDNSASYTAIDNHFPTTNRTLYINNETTHRSIAFWNKNGSDGYGFGLDNSGNFKVVYGSSERLRLTQDGSTIALGLGIVPQSGQYNGWTVLQIGESAALTSNRTTGDTNQTELSNNSYLNSNASAYKYHHADEATRYVQSHGRHTWYTAPSGSADANISFTEVMKVDASGYVTKPTTAAFNVRGTNMVRTNTNAYTCTFDDDSGTGCYDSGNNFNTSTWKFTAPVSGHYYFFTNIRLDSFSSGYIRTAILSTSYHAGTAYYNIPSTGHVIDYYTSPTNILHISTSTVMYVPATHEVWVHQDPSSDSSYTAYLAESSFGGYLIG